MNNTSDTSSVTVNQKIKYLRENNGLSIEDLAAATGVSASEIENIEEGNAEPQGKLLEMIAVKLQMPVSYFSRSNAVDQDSLNYLTRAMEKLSHSDHDELVQFAEFLQSVPEGK